MTFTATYTDGTTTATGEVLTLPAPTGITVTATVTIECVGFQTYNFFVDASVGNPVTYDVAGVTGSITAAAIQTFNLPPGTSTVTFSRSGANLTVGGFPSGDSGMTSAFKEKPIDDLLP